MTSTNSTAGGTRINTSKNIFKTSILFFVALGMVAGGLASLTVDDGNANTNTSYSTPATFIGSSLDIQGNDSHKFNLTDITGTEVSTAEGDSKLDTSGAAEGRAMVYDENGSASVAIDLIKQDSEVFGRTNGDIQDINAYTWLEGNEITGNDINYTMDNSWTNSEALYEMNISKDDYWLEVVTSTGSTIKSTRAKVQERKPGEPLSKPRVNDFLTAPGYTLDGWVNNSTGGQETSNLEIRVRRVARGYPSRVPYMTAPPVKTTVTNDTGYYNITGLQPGNYVVDVVNRSHARTNYGGPFEGGFMVDGDTVKNFSVTDSTGNVSLKLQGASKESVRYGFLLSKMSNASKSVYMYAGVEPNTVVNYSVPAGNYSLLAAKFIDSGDGFPSIVTDKAVARVMAGTTTSTKEIGFPAIVELSGKVENSTGGEVENARISVQNRSERASYYTTTNETGGYSVNVRNSTDYTVEVSAPYDSGYSDTSRNISVSGDTVEDFTLNEGPFIEGYVNDSTGVEDVRITAYNSTTYSYGRAETDSDGYYKIGGLEENTNYSVYVDTPEGYPRIQTKVYLNGSNETKNFDISKDLHSLSGTVENSEGEPLSGTLYVSKEDSVVKKTDITGGQYSLTGIERGFYRIRAVSSNSSYKEESEFTELDSDETVDFSIPKFTGVSGKIKDKTSQNGVEDVWVHAYNYSTRSYDSDRTGPDGKYSLEIANTSHKVRIYPGGGSDYTPKKANISKSDVGSTKDFNITKGSFISGKISDPGKANFSGFISVWNRSSDAYGYERFTGGTYNLTGLKDTGYNVYIYVKNDSYSSKRTTVSSSKIGGTKDFTFALNSGPKLWVTVKDATGSVVTNATVEVEGEAKRTNSNGLVKYDERKNKETVAIKATKSKYNSTIKYEKMSTTYTTSLGTSSRDIQNVTLVIGRIQDKLRDIPVNVTKNGNDVSKATVVARVASNRSSLNSADVTGSSGGATLQDLLPDKNYIVSISADGNFESKEISLGSADSSGSTTLGSYSLSWEVPK